MEKLIGIKEATELLNISRSTLFRYVSAGALPSSKIGKFRLFVLEELREWVEKQKEGEPPLVFKYRWITQMNKWIDETEKMFQDPQRIKNLSFHEQLRLYDKLNLN